MTEETMIPKSEYDKVVRLYTAEKTTAAQLITELAAEQRRSAEHWRECERLREELRQAQLHVSLYQQALGLLGFHKLPSTPEAK